MESVVDFPERLSIENRHGMFALEQNWDGASTTGG
jgi:hypothetical protein